MRYPTKKTEQHQLEQIHAGKETAIAEFLNQHKDQLFYAAYLLVKDRYLAEDIFQEACLRVIKSIRKGNYAEEGKLLPWVARIVRNLSIDYLRQAKKRIKVTLPNGEDIFSILDSGRKNHEEIMEQKQSCKTVREVLNQIPFKQREVVVMRIYGEMSFKDIAHLQGSSLNTVLGRMRYGLINMKKLIKEKNIVL